MTLTLAFELLQFKQAFVPLVFQTARHKSILRVDCIVLTLCALSLIASPLSSLRELLEDCVFISLNTFKLSNRNSIGKPPPMAV
ncbi:MAG: hypothetical protein ACM3ZE_10955 [Myxococcales bacterium]